MVPHFILLLFFQFCFTWGPLTHQVYPCFIYNISTTPECFGDNFYWQTIGNISPDSVKYLEPKLHTFEYATYQYLYAKSLKNEKFIKFSLGYGYHLAQDLVGHFQNSYLTPQHNRWMQIAIDSKMIFESQPNSTIFKYQNNNDQGIEFLYNSNVYYSKFNTNYKPHPLKNITDTIKSFEKVIYLHFQMARLNSGYKDQMKQYDRCKPQNDVEIERNFKRAHHWSIISSNYFRDLLNQNIPPNRVEPLMYEFVSNLFKRNNNTICF